MISRGRCSPQRVCDKCGAQRTADTMRVVTGRWICNWHDHFIAPETLEKQPLKTFKVKPFQGAKPLNPRDTYERAEWEILNFLVRSYNLSHYTIPDFASPAPVTASTATSYGVDSAAWTAIYCYELINENRRPHRMIAVARALLTSCAEFLVSRQYAGPNTANAATSADIFWGAWARGTVTYPPAAADAYWRVQHTAAAGLALLRAYQVIGDARYLTSARAAVWFCRSAQCTGMLATGFTSSDAAGTARLHLGTFPDYLLYSSGFYYSNDYFTPGELTALELYVAFKNVVGDEVIGSSNVAGLYSMSRATTLSAAIAEAVAFWTGPGVMDSYTGTVVNGFTTTTPLDAFYSYPSGGYWYYTDGTPAGSGTYIASDSWALGIRGLRAAVGDTPLVTGLFDWLMTFVSNPAHALPAEYTDRTLYGDLYTNGECDPKFSLPSELQVKTVGGVAGVPCTMSGTGRQAYDMGSTGLLAGLYSTRQQAKFKEFKDALNEPRHHSVGRGEDGRYHYLGLGGRCGFSLQPTQKNGRFYLPVHAARVGLAYRFAPKAFSERGRA